MSMSDMSVFERSEEPNAMIGKGSGLNIESWSKKDSTL
jgi:hypothetical protein